MSDMIKARKTAVLVPPCMLAPGIQAKEETDSRWRHAHLQLYLKYQVDIIPYPCAESTFHGYESGLLRSPHGIDYYRKLPEYEHHCQNLADCVTKKILAMQTGGYLFFAVVGIEHSPSCAISYLYSQHGTLKQSGLFVTALKECFTAAHLQIPFVGINRRCPRKSLRKIETLLQGAVYNPQGNNHITNDIGSSDHDNNIQYEKCDFRAGPYSNAAEVFSDGFCRE